jgi:signal transduction histidine kinase
MLAPLNHNDSESIEMSSVDLEVFQRLQQENQQLALDVKQLVNTESKLYSFQNILDRQIYVYRNLYELGKQLNGIVNLQDALDLITHFALYHLNFERCLVLLKTTSNQDFVVKAQDGFYEDTLLASILTLSLPVTDDSLAPLLTTDSTQQADYIVHVEDSPGSLCIPLQMDEYVIFALRSEQTQTQGLLIVGNTSDMFAHQTRVNDDNAITLGLANLASQAATAINTIHFYNQRNEYQQQLEAKVQARTQELNLKNQSLEQTLLELQQTQTQLIHSEKMSSIGQLVAGVAHEINNPVSFIYGNIYPATSYAEDLLALLALYQYHYPEPVPAIQSKQKEIDPAFIAEDFPQVLSSMKIGAERIKDIVLSLRTFSRKDEAEMKPVDLHAGIDSTLLILRNRLKATADRPEIKIDQQYGQLPLVECYAGQLNQVLMNLLANAIDALDEHYAMQKQREEEKALAIAIHTHTDNQHNAIITITDNGPGIAAHHISKLFDPFFTTKPVGKGTGLGLSISYQIITEKHGGTLTCQSQLGQGTTFCIQIPLKQPGCS